MAMASRIEPASRISAQMNSAHVTLQSRVVDTLRPLLGPSDRCALIDFPNYPNVGDSAIYLGELECLATLGVPHPVFVCDISSYNQQALAQQLGDGTILLAGGGNFGDLWPVVQELREEIIRSFPRNRVIQLPQTIHFQRADALRRARDVIGAHVDFTMLVRDHQSRAIAQRELGIDALLCPDMALCLDPLKRSAATQDIVRLGRTDAEAADHNGANEFASVDWLQEERSWLHWINERLSESVRGRPLDSVARGLQMRTFAPLARARLSRGARLLSSGQVVITDRLHGHILCLLLRIPHVLLDNSYGKVSSFYNSWTRGTAGVYWAESPREALELAEQIVGNGPLVTEPEDDAGG
jgi:pyruvyl transferase EpsO